MRKGRRKKNILPLENTPLSRALNSTMAARDIEKLPPPPLLFPAAVIRSALKNENSCTPTLSLSDYF